MADRAHRTGPHRAMRVRGGIAAALVCMFGRTVLEAQGSGLPAVRARSAAEALQILISAGISPGGPLSGDGDTIAGVLVGQSLTFPVATSSGAFVTRDFTTFSATKISVATSGNFGAAFGERGLTNGRRRWSSSLVYQRLSWSSLSGVPLAGHQLVQRRVARIDSPGKPAGTIDEGSADVSYDTSALVVSVNYGAFQHVDVGVAVPFIRAAVSGTKRTTVTRPQQDTQITAVLPVSGLSEGIGDTIVRAKGAYQFDWDRPTRRWYRIVDRIELAIGYDVRLPTGKEATLSLDCKVALCVADKTQKVPDIGLGVRTHKALLVISAARGGIAPFVNVSRTWVKPYKCDKVRFSPTGLCKGSIFEVDPVNNTYDAKNQGLSDEFAVTAGTTTEVIPYRLTASVEVIARRLVNAGQFYQAPAMLVYKQDGGTLAPEPAVVTRMETRPGHVDAVTGVAAMKLNVLRRWVVTASLVVPLNQQGLQPHPALVTGVERAWGR
jgi:hypothetical protein